ncbi:MAG: class I SAM-dependent methyltransferase [Chloroflexi bacterium]|nr:class I SAM-dependent methyltransferase [Chloroflexota bacterium]
MPDEPNPWLATRSLSGDDYDARYETAELAGKDVHGEASFVESCGARSVLDAGCGTGRVGRELARRGLDVVGVDLDADMLATAQRKAPEVDWRLADLAKVDLGRLFEAAVAAGNVMIFLTPGTERAVITNLARHLSHEGLLIAGFQLTRPHMTLERYDALCLDARLDLAERFRTWDRDPWRPGGDYAVSVHRRR